MCTWENPQSTKLALKHVSVDWASWGCILGSWLGCFVDWGCRLGWCLSLLTGISEVTTRNGAVVVLVVVLVVSVCNKKRSNVGSHVILEIVDPQWPTPVGYCGGGFSVCAPFGVSVGYCVGHCRRPQSGSLRPYVSICEHMCTYGSCFLKDSCSKHPTNLPLTQSPLQAVLVIGKCEQGRRAQRKTLIGGDWKTSYLL